ncbi:anti-sigma regulatory factor (Ser/Thr protein kinase) [Streptomyces sp. PvR034]
MISPPRRHCVVALQAMPQRIGQVRRIVSAQLRHWQLDPLIDRAALGVTELLSNVHRHAQPDKACRVEIELRLGRLTVSVHDSDPRLPVARDADPLETGGRGLALIAAVSESWGSRPQPESRGKVVWFTLRAAPAAAAPAPAVRIRPVSLRRPTAPPVTLATGVTAPPAQQPAHEPAQRPARHPARPPARPPADPVVEPSVEPLPHPVAVPVAVAGHAAAGAAAGHPVAVTAVGPVAAAAPLGALGSAPG